MNRSTTSDKHIRVVCTVLSVVFWLCVWEISARLINVRFLFPAFTDVVARLLVEIVTGDFWLSVSMSLVRILLGFIIGTFLGIVFAFAASYTPVFYLVKPLITLTRSMPVASFIMILWLLVSDPLIPSLIAILMVFPVVWENAYLSIVNPPKDLDEMALVFEFSRRKRFIYLTLPIMLKSTLPSIITASGLAWKAGVAAEIITYTKNSIGRNISEAKNMLEGAEMFAWTAVVVLFSIIVENVIRYYARKAESVWEY